jgi:hypothetical protein
VDEITALDGSWMVLSGRYDIFIDALVRPRRGPFGRLRRECPPLGPETSTRRWAL